MKDGRFTTYIMASPTGTLYIGITNDTYFRVAQHKAEINKKSFASKYHCKKLVYLESFWNPDEAIAREKQLKGWDRKKKEWLIKNQNPTWKDLSYNWELPTADSTRVD